MNKSAWFAASAALAILSCGAPASAKPLHKPYTVLWNQNSNFGQGIISDNGGATCSAYDDAAADDLVVPKGKTWKVEEVDVTGVYYNGSGPASSENVTVYADSKGRPGKSVWSASDMACADSAGSFSCTLGNKGPKLMGGKTGARYWLSVVANCSFTECGEWGWVKNTVVQGKGAVLEQGCGHWKRIKPPTDLAFALSGKS